MAEHSLANVAHHTHLAPVAQLWGRVRVSVVSPRGPCAQNCPVLQRGRQEVGKACLVEETVWAEAQGLDRGGFQVSGSSVRLGEEWGQIGPMRWGAQ